MLVADQLDPEQREVLPGDPAEPQVRHARVDHHHIDRGRDSAGPCVLGTVRIRFANKQTRNERRVLFSFGLKDQSAMSHHACNSLVEPGPRERSLANDEAATEPQLYTALCGQIY
eukprot:scaffold179126_cov36-Prasinocladus_malaysianus.AAC.1